MNTQFLFKNSYNVYLAIVAPNVLMCIISRLFNAMLNENIYYEILVRHKRPGCKHEGLE